MSRARNDSRDEVLRRKRALRERLVARRASLTAEERHRRSLDAADTLMSSPDTSTKFRRNPMTSGSMQWSLSSGGQFKPDSARSPVCSRNPRAGPVLPRSANPATTGRTAPTVARQPASLGLSAQVSEKNDVPR